MEQSIERFKTKEAQHKQIMTSKKICRLIQDEGHHPAEILYILGFVKQAVTELAIQLLEKKVKEMESDS